MRRKKKYFKMESGDPAPIEYTFSRRVIFGDVDAMAVVWHGQYARIFESAATELRRICGLTYKSFWDAKLYAPVVQFHVDYHQSLLLDEMFTVTARMVYTEAARINIEYTILKEDGALAATGYTVQLFTSAETNLPCLVLPPMLKECHTKWLNGEYS